MRGFLFELYRTGYRLSSYCKFPAHPLHKYGFDERLKSTLSPHVYKKIMFCAKSSLEGAFPRPQRELECMHTLHLLLGDPFQRLVIFPILFTIHDQPDEAQWDT